MQKIMMTNKIHMARLTGAEIDYEGSLAIDPDFLEEAGILPYEKILVTNRRNGERIETYAIPGKRGSKEFVLNGPAALKGQAGDVIVVMVFSICTPEEARQIYPRVIVLDENNNIVHTKGNKNPLLPE